MQSIDKLQQLQHARAYARVRMVLECMNQVVESLRHLGNRVIWHMPRNLFRRCWDFRHVSATRSELSM